MVQVNLPLEFTVYAQESTSVKTVWNTARRLTVPRYFVAFIDSSGNAFQIRESKLKKDFTLALADAQQL